VRGTWPVCSELTAVFRIHGMHMFLVWYLYWLSICLSSVAFVTFTFGYFVSVIQIAIATNWVPLWPWSVIIFARSRTVAKAATADWHCGTDCKWHGIPWVTELYTSWPCCTEYSRRRQQHCKDCWLWPRSCYQGTFILLRAIAECFARLSHVLGVCPSVTPLSPIKTMQARIMKSLL